MGSSNCCHNGKKLEDKMPDIENLKFDTLDYNRSSTYKKLEVIALEVASQKGIPLYYNSLICRIIAHRQEHLLRVLNEIYSMEERQHLLQSLEMIDYELLDSLYFNYFVGESKKRKKSLIETFEYQPFTNYYSMQDIEKSTLEFYRLEGLNLIRQRKVGLCILAGGSNERFGGFTKSLASIRLPSEKCILQILIERVIKLQRIAMKPLDDAWDGTLDRVPIYIVCNEENFYEMKNFVNDNKSFGLPQQSISFFIQPSIQALDQEGHVVLTERRTIQSKPAGTGSALSTFLQANFLTKALNQNLQFIHFLGAENVLAYPLDPTFLGISHSKKVGVSCKSINSSEQTSLPYAVYCNQTIKILDRVELLELEELPRQDMLISDCQQIMNDVLVNVLYLQAFQKDQNKKQDWSQKYHVVQSNVQGKQIYVFEKYIQDILEVCKQPLVFNVDRLSYYAPVLYRQSEQSLNQSKSQLKVGDLSHISESFLSQKHSVSSSTSSLPRKNIFENAKQLDKQTFLCRGSFGNQSYVSMGNKSTIYNQTERLEQVFGVQSETHPINKSEIQIPKKRQSDQPFEKKEQKQYYKRVPSPINKELREGDIKCALQQLSLNHKKWMKLKFASQGDEILEISPLVSYQGEDLAKYSSMSMKKFHFPKHIE